MPVQGPTYSNEYVDLVYREVFDFLKSRFTIQLHDPKSFLRDWTNDRIMVNEQLKKAIEEIIKLESYESW